MNFILLFSLLNKVKNLIVTFSLYSIQFVMFVIQLHIFRNVRLTVQRVNWFAVSATSPCLCSLDQKQTNVSLTFFKKYIIPCL